MSTTIDQQNLTRTNRAILDLQKKDATEAKKVADNTIKMNRAMSAASKATNEATARSRFNEADRASREVERAQNSRASIADQISRKTAEAMKLKERISKKQADDEAKRVRDAEALQKKQERRLKEIEKSAIPDLRIVEKSHLSRVRALVGQHDVFISHASEDKEGFVTEFASAAKEAGIDVWYDEFSIKWGNSLRQTIDRGLANSYFGIVVLSENFFRKEWTSYELDGLIQKESIGLGGVLPIWHKVTKDEVTDFSPPLANRLALNTANMSIEEIVAELKKMVDEIKNS